MSKQGTSLTDLPLGTLLRICVLSSRNPVSQMRNPDQPNELRASLKRGRYSARIEEVFWEGKSHRWIVVGDPRSGKNIRSWLQDEQNKCVTIEISSK